MCHATRHCLSLLVLAAGLLAGCATPEVAPYEPPTLPMCETPFGGSWPVTIVLTKPVTGLDVAPSFEPQRLPPGSRWRVRVELEATAGFALIFEPQAVCPSGPCQSYDVVELDTLPSGAAFEDGARLVERVGERLVIELDETSPPGRLLAVRTDTGETDIVLTGTRHLEIEPAAPVVCEMAQAPRALALVIPAVCGNGLVEGDEACDDANMRARDGCSASCRIEPAMCLADTAGWVVADCAGAPSVCTRTSCTLDSEAPACLASRAHLVLEPALETPGRATGDLAGVGITVDGAPLDCRPRPGVLASRCEVPVAPCGEVELAVDEDAAVAVVCGDETARRCVIEPGPGETPVEVVWAGLETGVERVQRDAQLGSSLPHPEGGLVTSTFVRPALEYRLERLEPSPDTGSLEVQWSVWTGDGYQGQPMGMGVGPDGASYVAVTRYSEPDDTGLRTRRPAELWRVDADGEVSWRVELTDRDVRSTTPIAVAPDGHTLLVAAMAAVAEQTPGQPTVLEWMTWRIDARTGAMEAPVVEPARGTLGTMHLLDDGTVLRSIWLGPADAQADWLEVPGVRWALPAGTAAERDLVSRVERVDLDAGRVLWARQWYAPSSRGHLELAGTAADGTSLWTTWLRPADDENLSTGGSPWLIALDADGQTRSSLALTKRAGCEESVHARSEPDGDAVVVAMSHHCEGSLDAVTVERVTLHGTTHWTERIDATDDVARYPDASMHVHEVVLDARSGRVMVSASQRPEPAQSATGRLLVLSP